MPRQKREVRKVAPLKRKGRGAPRAVKGSPPHNVPKAPAAPEVVVERRINAVFAAVVAGLQSWEIRQAVAHQQTKERRDRATAREKHARAADPELEATRDVPIVWGDRELAERTIQQYIGDARAILLDQAGKFADERDHVLAQQKARLDGIYAQAQRDGKLYAALKAVELTDALFNLREHARTLQLRQPGSAQELEPRTMPTDAQGRADAFSLLVRSAITNDPGLRQDLASLIPAPQVMP